MECHRVTIDLNKKDDLIHLRPLGDVHVGNLAWDKEKFERNIKFLQQKDDHYTIGMGDYIDNIQAWANGTMDKRWNPETVERDRMTTDEQIDYFVQEWAKIAHKSFGMHSGNHEWKTITQKRFIKDFCTPVDPKDNTRTMYQQKYLGRIAMTGITFKYKGKETAHYEMVSLHGGYSGMRAGGTINRLEDIVSSFNNIDIGLMGHTHRAWVVTEILHGRDRTHNTPYEQKVILANTGTFLKTYVKGVDSYIEANPRKSTRVGTVTLTFDPENKDIYGHD